jgi:hypothetical protein
VEHGSAHVVRTWSVRRRHDLGHVGPRVLLKGAAAATDVHEVAALKVWVACASKADDPGGRHHVHGQLTSTDRQWHAVTGGCAQNRPGEAETPRASPRTRKTPSLTRHDATEGVVGEDRKETRSEVDRVLDRRFSLASDRQSREHVHDSSNSHRLVDVVARTSGHHPSSEDASLRHLHRKPEVQRLIPPNRSGARGAHPARFTATKRHEARDAQAQKWKPHGDDFGSKPAFRGGRR